MARRRPQTMKEWQEEISRYSGFTGKQVFILYAVEVRCSHVFEGLWGSSAWIKNSNIRESSTRYESQYATSMKVSSWVRHNVCVLETSDLK